MITLKLILKKPFKFWY